MQSNSSPITSSQKNIHSGLEDRVKRSLQTTWQRPIAQHSLDAFAQVNDWLSQRKGHRLVLDSGCGVGISTRLLARQYPRHSVIGIDRSSDRLKRDHGSLPDNACLVRADLVDLWRLALQAGWAPEYHFLLYPNPYPKPGLLKHRWHGHPVFPDLLALGGKIELRSNWKIYVQEFALAFELVTGQPSVIEQYDPKGHYLTPFERKYDLSGHDLWRMRGDLSNVVRR